MTTMVGLLFFLFWQCSCIYSGSPTRTWSLSCPTKLGLRTNTAYYSSELHVSGCTTPLESITSTPDPLRASIEFCCFAGNCCLCLKVCLNAVLEGCLCLSMSFASWTSPGCTYSRHCRFIHFLHFCCSTVMRLTVFPHHPNCTMFIAKAWSSEDKSAVGTPWCLPWN